MLLIKTNGPLDCGVTERVAVGKVLGDDTRAGLVFLFKVVVVLVFGVCCVGGLACGDVFEGLGGLDSNDRGTQLGLVEEKGGLCSSVV